LYLQAGPEFFTFTVCEVKFAGSMNRVAPCLFLLLFQNLVAAQVPVTDTLHSSANQNVKIPETVFVSGGTFKMGMGSLVESERPAHAVNVNSFHIGKYEVTQQEYASVMGPGGMENFFPGCDSCPVERVSWFHIQEYLKRLNELTGLNYRLPSEAEWEYAARGGVRSKGFKYSGSNAPQPVGWTVGLSGGRTHPVGLKRPNELGIYDMTGNVYEWCSDYFDPQYYQVSTTENPQGPATGDFRVMRGGSWYYDSAGLKVTDRGKGNPDCRYGFVGFRICRSAD
jgi:sulfatase modifying factor 1